MKKIFLNTWTSFLTSPDVCINTKMHLYGTGFKKKKIFNYLTKRYLTNIFYVLFNQSEVIKWMLRNAPWIMKACIFFDRLIWDVSLINYVFCKYGEIWWKFYDFS